MTKYFRTQPYRFAQRSPDKPVEDPPLPLDSDKPRKDPQPLDPDKPVDSRPYDPDPTPGDPIVDPADEPLLQT